MKRRAKEGEGGVGVSGQERERSKVKRRAREWEGGVRFSGQQYRGS